MKIRNIVFGLLLSFFLVSCASKPTESSSSNEEKTPKIEKTDIIEEKKVEPQKKETKKIVEKKRKEPEDPPNISFAKKLKVYLEKFQVKEAIALFDELPKELENDIDFKIILGSLYLSDKQYDNTIDVANQALQIDSQNIAAYELITLALDGKGDKKAKKENIDKILAIDPFNVTINIQKAEDYALNKKYKLAAESYKKALKKEPENLDALFGYAQMSFYTDDIKNSEKSFQKILEIEPTNEQALAYMGKLAADDENYLRATKYVKEALKYDPYNYDYYLDYGTYLRYQGKYAEAEKAWKKAAEIDPTYFLAFAYLAGHYDELSKFDLALENKSMEQIADILIKDKVPIPTIIKGNKRNLR